MCFSDCGLGLCLLEAVFSLWPLPDTAAVMTRHSGYVQDASALASLLLQIAQAGRAGLCLAVFSVSAESGRGVEVTSFWSSLLLEALLEPERTAGHLVALSSGMIFSGCPGRRASPVCAGPIILRSLRKARPQSTAVAKYPSVSGGVQRGTLPHALHDDEG